MQSHDTTEEISSHPSPVEEITAEDNQIFYCKRGGHFEILARVEKTSELFHECPSHDTVMLNIVISDEYIAWIDMQYHMKEDNK